MSIVYATDWGTLNVPGMLVDDTKVTVNGVTVAETSFETDQGGWDDPGRPPGGPVLEPATTGSARSGSSRTPRSRRRASA